MKTACNTAIAQQGIWPLLFERACGLENENETFFVELWHICDACKKNVRRSLVEVT